jgi:putative DNA primase/helicase
MRYHRADDHMTKMTAVTPGGECPMWLAFLDRAMNSDPELIAFIQRIAGYALTGSTREQALFFAYGTGANGKGVTLNALTGMLGSYALVSGMETFTASQNDRHSTELARLRGARLVTAQETEEGRSWAEARIKALTGGDPVTARFMRQDDFTFQPEFKLVIAGNHRPALRNVDEAIRRRFNLIPFAVKIPAEQRDKDLPEKLKAEWPGILRWAIEGCLAWQKDGLRPPETVRAATDEYLAAEDAMGLWLSECCHVSATYRTTSLELFASWKMWAERSGEIPGSRKRFNQALEPRGFNPCRQSGTGRAAFDGIGLKPTQSCANKDNQPPYDGCSDA